MVNQKLTYMKYTPSDKPNTRIDVADILRGIAIAGKKD